MPYLLLLHATATWAMTGVIWYVQVAHYPLFARVDAGAFRRFEAEHVRRTTWVVTPLMLAEAISLALLLLNAPQPPALRLSALPLLAAWLSTAFIQVPLHRRLEASHDPAAIRRLVSTNWIRTACWSTRAGLLFVVMATGE